MSKVVMNPDFSVAHAHKSSFRDPSAQIYQLEEALYRQINEAAYDDYVHLMNCGLYKKLTTLEYLIVHEESPIEFALNPHAKKVIKPQKIPFISYCYEWSFSQYKDAALLTLEIAKLALQHGMMLKDASAYNIQFYKGKPIFIDTTSFEKYKEGSPWVAYNQFCRHFLAPLLLMAKVDIRLGNLTREYIEGIPLDLASKLLPKKTKFSFSILAHIHAHAKAQQKYSDAAGVNTKSRTISKNSLLGLLENLLSVVRALEWKPIKTEWGDYYNQTNYSAESTDHKSQLVKQFVEVSKAQTVWDLGGNNGFYSRIAASTGAKIVCFDIDPMAVETNYRKVKQEKEQAILPLLQDLTNPSPSIGWDQIERDGLSERGQVDLVMALALIHHLAISNNLPLKRIADFFAKLSHYLLIEFVPKEDSQVQRLLKSREDIFSHYTLEHFISAFSKKYSILEQSAIPGTCRTLFLMKRSG